MAEIIGRGAEAIIYKDNDVVIKDRISKSYRHPVIDNNLRKFRTRREAKILEKLRKINFPGPSLISSCDQSMKINMEFIEGKKLRDVLEQNHLVYSEEIGKLLGILHSNGIIHADLTTSNMILKDRIHFIDFGLSFFSDKAEDKAVDLHLLDRALESKHYRIHKPCMKFAIKGYKQTYKNHKEVLNRLEKVQERGRNKNK
ncbi:Kae1-associated serine/threonine protein kinase [Candidatus Woesearchaeota archaeon]|nr:Kae1-associated serine/threonine protein kinase [Candidatus Woesearchaeota archaeon]